MRHHEFLADSLFSVYEEERPMAATPARQVINIATVPHRSPFRYPGGKTWLVPRIREWLRSISPQPRELVEPFAGGAIVGLSALFENLVQKLVLVEKDEDVGSVWETLVYGDGRRLGDQILNFDLTEGHVRSVLQREPTSVFDRAFATILKNRVQRGGILAPGASFIKNGENGRGLKSRWYPETLKRRIDEILRVRSEISFLQADGTEFIKYNAFRPDIAFFIDPPYTVAGRRLYKYSELDHERLFRTVSEIKGDFLMTYDDCKEITYLAKKFQFETHRVRMKNGHHQIMSELLVSRRLDWARS
jgi:DNA adenine methylase